MITKFVAKVQTNGKKVDKNDINFKIVANFAVVNIRKQELLHIEDDKIQYYRGSGERGSLSLIDKS